MRGNGGITKALLIKLAIVLVAFSCDQGLCRAETGTVKISGVSADYVITTPQRGVGLTREEVLDLVQKSQPATPFAPVEPKNTNAK
jgi:hypothetical protein